MSTLPEDDIPMPDDDDETQKSFEAGCLRFLVGYLVAYFTLAIISTVVSAQTGTHWWILGWGWPLFVTLAIMVGVNLGAWSENDRSR